MFTPNHRRTPCVLAAALAASLCGFAITPPLLAQTAVPPPNAAAPVAVVPAANVTAIPAPGVNAPTAVPVAAPTPGPGTSSVAPAVTAAIDPAHLSSLRTGLDTAWVLIAAMLVFWMNAGFALVESGLCQQKNCVNILFKNFIVFAISTLSFWVIGWDLMFADGATPWMANLGSYLVSGADNSPALGEAYAAMNPFSTARYDGIYGAINWTPVPLWAKFFFQLVFAGTAATIVSGAVAERIKFHSFIIFSVFLVAVVYPISGHWIWGGGILGTTPAADNPFGNFRDFAGSTVVHSVGGWAALAGVIVLGARRGKYKDGKVHPIPGHNMTSAALGVLILWLGWFGFNPGSTMAAMDGAAIAHILVNTNIAAACGALAALLTAWSILRKPDLSMVLNGCLAGLVAITAPCAFTTIANGALIGAIGGVLVVLAVLFFDKIKLDDPVGALSVHLVNGVWGTLALGLFYDTGIAKNIAALDTGLTARDQLIQQLKGVALVGGFVFVISLILWFLIKLVFGLRVSRDEESEGLDIGEHGNVAYPDFHTTSHL